MGTVTRELSRGPCARLHGANQWHRDGSDLSWPSRGSNWTHPAVIFKFSREAVSLLLAVPLIFLLALAIRWPDLDRFATIDESRWIQRGADFWTSMQKRDAEGTFLIGHPGVSTMWLVGLGMGSDAIEHMATRPGRPDVTRREGYLNDLVNARHAFVLVA